MDPPAPSEEPSCARCRPCAYEAEELLALGENLRQRREQLGLNPEDVAARAGMAPEVYTSIEAGQVDPGTRKLLVIARALETSPSELLRHVV